ncbi:MAG: S41 family peptidase [Muribaculum sp.]|nr:S41 family peptidase [Muribaculaceae bacterium]MCM1080745.1 S41 family peptidase [Muribaculum sp.]
MTRKPIIMLAVAAALQASAVTPLWLRDVKISPDAQKIAFTYKGDIFTVPVGGGNATRLTTNAAYDEQPVWSPDGKTIAFASDRNGSADVYVMSANGGNATRLTKQSGSETPWAFSPDGKYIYFSTHIQDAPESALFPSSRMTELYRVPVGGGRAEMVVGTPAEMISFVAPDNKTFLYQDNKGMEDQWRKHHTSSVTRELWLYDTATKKHTNLTAHPGEDRNPVASPDGKTMYFLSERDGKTMNVYSAPLAQPTQVKQLTNFKTHPVRFLSQGSDGTLAFTYDGEIYTMRNGATPQKVNINITLDEENPIKRLSVNTSGEATASPDGKQVAFTNRGELFVTSVEYKTTKQITNTPQAESEPAWNPDNRTIAYVSERDGHFNIYEATITRDDELNFPNATTIAEKAVFPASDKIDRTHPVYSPDGKQMAFIEGRQKLMVRDVKSGKVRQLTDGTTNPERYGSFDYSWSPDGKWILFELTGNGHEPYTDIAVVNTEGTPQVRNLTQSSYFDQQARWVLDGNAIAFGTERYGMRNHASWGSQYDVMLMFLNQDAYDKFRLSKEDYELRKELEKRQKSDKEKASKKDSDKSDSKKADKKDKTEQDSAKTKDINIEFEGIRDRIVRLTPNSSNLADYAITPDGQTLYYLTSFEDGNDLWKLDLRKREPSIAKKLNTGMRHLSFDKDGKNMFLLGSRGMSKMALSSEKVTPITYSAVMKIDPAAEREYMFNYVKQEEKNRFYDKRMHGVDWEAMTKAYTKFLPHINNNYDFTEMLSELLGELNVSHTGARYYPTGSGDRTASLGLLFDLNYDGKGLKVAEVVANGPFDHANTLVKAGTVINAINGQEIEPDADITTLLADIAGKKTLVAFTNPGAERTEEVVLPISTAAMNNLLYKRWVKQRAADVDSLSGGRLGYVHIQSMNDASFRNIYTDLLGKYVDKEGIVIDIRWNGGGRLHEDIEVLFSGDKYLTQVIRGQEICDMPSRRWNKPSIMVQCEACYSNAHGTPWVYKHKNLGKLVGAPVPGTMTSVNWVDLQDDSMLFGIPVIGYRTAEGNYLENSQLEPDVYVLNEPDVIVTGRDQQLEKAVEVLLRDIDAAKKKK